MSAYNTTGEMMSQEIITKPEEKIKLKKASEDLKPSEVLRQATGKFKQCTGDLCKLDWKKEWQFCALGVLAFEKGFRPYAESDGYTTMRKDGDEIYMSSVLSLYGIKGMNEAEVYGRNDSGSSFDEVAKFLESRGC